MPKVVEQIPCPWLKYMDGNIWEFTPQEIREMPEWNKQLADDTGVGMLAMLIGDHAYVVFYNMKDYNGDPNMAILARWNVPRIPTDA